MTISPFDAMQMAVDIVLTSEHIKNKIASCLFNDMDTICGINYRPDSLSNCFTPDIRIGDSSQFIHSEVGCIYNAPFPTDGASLCVTDPFCPNCAKAIAESGIRHVYIDHKGLDKDFAMRRGDDFTSLSLLIMERAGIHVSIVYRKEKRIEELLVPKIQTRLTTNGIEFFDCTDEMSLEDILKGFRTRQPHTAWACSKVKETNGTTSGILVFEGLPPGVTPNDFIDKKDGDAKYSMTIDPINRLLFYIKRKNIELLDMAVASNLTPSSRALVNMSGFGVQTLLIGEHDHDEKPSQIMALDILQKNGVIKINVL